MKPWKKFLCVFTALTLLLITLASCGSSSSDESVIIDGLLLELDPETNTYTVVGVEDGYDLAHCKIPSSHNGHAVTTIGPKAFKDQTGITMLSIPSSITKICGFAFAGCTGLETVDIPSGVQVIESGAFQNCTAHIFFMGEAIPSGWVSDWNGSSGALSVNGVRIPTDSSDTDTTTNNNTNNNNNNNNNNNTNTNNNTNNNSSSSTYSEGLRFMENVQGGTKSYTVVGIGTCQDENIVIPPTYKLLNREYPVTAIGDNAFHGCTKIKSIVIPDSVSKIGKNILSGCSSLESITTPFVGQSISMDSYTLGYFFGTAEFTGSEKVTQHTGMGYNMSLELIDYYIPTSLTSVTLTGSSGTISMGEFSNCANLTSVKMSESYSYIGERAFYGCTNLTSIFLPDKISGIGNMAFMNCANLTTVTFQSNQGKLESIGESAFDGCEKLSSINLPYGVKTIGEEAFNGCKALTSITLYGFLEYVGSRAFKDCTSLTNIYIAKSQSATADWHSDWNDETNAQITYNYNA